jgi:3-methyladenine DNA glycosylase AlkD
MSNARLTKEIISAISAGAGAVPEVRRIRRVYSSKLADRDADAIIDLARRMVRHDTTEARFVAYELVEFHRAASLALTAAIIRDLGSGFAAWADVDSFAHSIAGPAWKRGQLSDATVLVWTRSRDHWWRRAALASTVTLNRKPVADQSVERTLAICAQLVTDREDLVVKAVSWALREASKVDPQRVRSFLTEHDETIAPRVKREVMNKLRTGRKYPRS